MIAAALFDWGDTLVKTEWSDEIARAGNEAALAALGRADLPDAEAFAAYFAEHELANHDREDEVDLVEAVRACFGELGCTLEDDELARYIDVTHEVWHRYYTVPSTSLALLESLRERGLRLGIVSNVAAPPRVIERVLEEQGLAPRVDAVVLSSEVGKRKPHPAVFERALDELGVAAADCLFVGDRRYHDVRGAAQLGMTTVQALWYRADEHADGWDADFEAFTQMDVLNVVRRLNGER